MSCSALDGDPEATMADGSTTERRIDREASRVATEA
jgi:hypothetical protein